MTAVNAIASGARGRMVTDSAAYTPDGVMVGTVPKAVPLAHLGLVFASRGASAARWTIAEELEQFASFDAIVTGAAAALREAHEDGAFGEAVDVVLLGWSEARRRVELYSLSSVTHPGLAAFTLHSMRLVLAPMPADDVLGTIGLKVGSAWDVSGPEAKLLDVVELQRRTPAPLGASPSAPMGYGVGGAAVLTEVSEAGISQRVVRRWPDVIGRCLTRADVEPAPLQAPSLVA